MPEGAALLGYARGPQLAIPTCNLAEFAFSNAFQRFPNQVAPIASDEVNEHHIFDNQRIPVQRPALVDAETGACVTWERLHSDSLKIARSIRAIIGAPIPFDSSANKANPIFSTRTNILICLPNCFAFPCVVFGAWAAQCAVTTAGILLTPDELAVILAKTRPRLMFIGAGKQGEERMIDALEIILHGNLPEAVPSRVRHLANDWAQQFKEDWSLSRQARFSKGDQLPIVTKRVWTVNVGGTNAGPTDYYGSSFRRDGGSTSTDPRDWTQLLVPPPGHRHAERLDSVDREAFSVTPMSREEQKQRTALILWSSGTTGTSKAVLISHYALIASVSSIWASLPVFHGPRRSQGETWLAQAPWTHMFGFTAIMVPAIAIGATLILPSAGNAKARFDLERYLQLVRRYAVTHLQIAPPVVVQIRDYLLEHGKISGVESVRGITCGGAPTSYNVIRTIAKMQGWTVHQAYGSTETCSTSHATSDTYDTEQGRAQEEIGSVGVPFVNVEVAIRSSADSEAANRRKRDVIADIERSGDQIAVRLHTLHDSYPGEVWIRGPGLMQGYYSGLDGQEELIDRNLTDPVMTRDGYYMTGDEGMLDAHGQLWIVGRLKDLIKCKGYSVAPAELDALYSKDDQVREAVAVGELNRNGEEEICVYLVPMRLELLRMLEQEQREFVDRIASQAMHQSAQYKWPSHVVLCSAIPKNPSGKILRKDLPKVKGKRFAVNKRDSEPKSRL